jgi:hypothetical protein
MQVLANINLRVNHGRRGNRVLRLRTITLSHVPGVIKTSVEPVATCIVWKEPDKEILKTLDSKG